MNAARLTWSLAVALTALAGCTLVTDPARHQGGTPTDAGHDAATTDAAGDAGHEDAAITDDAAVVREDAGPMECTTDAECPMSSHCVEGRCTLCVPSTPSILDVHADPGLQDDLDLVVAEDGATREIVLAWRGAGTRIYLHRTPVDAPASPGTFTSATDAITTLGLLDGVSSVDDVAIGAGQYAGTSDGRIDLTVIGHLGAAQTFLGAVIYTNSATTPINSSTFPDPERYNAPDQVYARATIVGSVVAFRSTMAGTRRIETRDVAYLNVTNSATSGIPAGDPGTIELAADRFLLTDPANAAQAFTWEPGDTGVDTLATPDRTGDPTAAQVGTSTFAMLYPAGSELYLRQIDCTGTCMSSPSVRADVHTGADEIAWARIAPVNGQLVVLSAERTGTTWRTVLRAFRADYSPLTMPGRTSHLVLDEATMPDTLPIGRLAVATSGGVATHVVASWLDHPASGARTLRVTSMPLVCTP